MRLRCVLPALLLLVVGCGSGQAQVAGDDLPVSTELARATFDSVTSRIARTHPDTAYNGLDWEAESAALRPRLTSTRTLGELRGLLGELLGQLGQSHFRIVPLRGSPLEVDGAGSETVADVVESVAGGVGIEVTTADSLLVVTRVFDSSPADREGVRPGWIVTRVGDWDLRDAARSLLDAPALLDRRVAELTLLDQVNERLRGRTGSMLDVGFVDESRERVIAFEREPEPGEWIRIGALPPTRLRFSSDRVESDTGCVGVIRFDNWLPAVDSLFSQALDRLSECRGLVLDLRGNRGGLAAMARGLAGHFFSEPTSLGRTRSRTGTVELVASPRRGDRTFDGPLAILVDTHSMSTSEIFAHALQEVGRARVFGTPTSGFALSAAVAPLPSGDLLLHGVGAYYGPGGALLEGRGVVPDEQVETERSDRLSGEDPVRAEAFFWIAGEIGDTH